ncbi:2Fe-2S iron-sulfur cluster-binding protein [Xylophilus sp. GOD-11R]|uniref:2Fe-2S iron-sulfur cluster-binding protein n=1 Tax=Xylophilus sp. GOD-11R TaxID=3089814 RepID=UPI00298C9E27|nr:2Fe-2S iron-sulfur cluster-binding protein [Xylophilus sp. GOD-11R]WPB55779.1 2Fe-2S iron-sulfur cluster-binding protein [Xylophilus sp. GOD-11R]
MPLVHFEQADGAVVSVELKTGQSVMYGSLTHRVPGILGECGGSLACATCHVYVDDAWADRLPPMSELENEMLDATISPRQPGSRLACQIDVSPALDGLRLRLPEAQI